MFLNSLRGRLTLIMIGLAVVPWLFVGAGLTYRSFGVQQQQAEDLEVAVAEHIAAETDAFVTSREAELYAVTAVNSLVTLAPAEQAVVLRRLLAQEASTEELTLLAADGRQVMRIARHEATSEADGGSQPIGHVFNFAGEVTWNDAPEYTIPRTERRTYYSPVEFDEATGQPLMTISIPLYDLRTNDLTNVLVSRFQFNTVWQLLVDYETRTGEQVYIVDVNGRVVAHRTPSVVLSGTTYEVPETAGQHSGLNGDDVVLGVTTLQLGTQQLNVISEITTAEAYQPAYETLTIIAGAVLGVALLTAVLGVFVLTRVTRPIVALANRAQALGGGDFSVRAVPTGGTEMRAVASAFNDMADQLQTLVDSLEHRVQARTRDLEIAARVSEQAATILDLEALLPQLVELTKENFDLYHAHVYLLDEDAGLLNLRAGAGEPGRVMLERGHRINLSASSLVARAAREHAPVVVDDVRDDPNFLANPLLPDTRSEAAFPLMVQDRVVGVLDVQATQTARFDQDLQSVLSTMAGQIGVAINNARLFVEVERNSRHQQALNAIAQEMQSATNLDELLQTAARELGRALRVPQTVVELKMPEPGSAPDRAPRPAVDRTHAPAPDGRTGDLETTPG